MADSVEARLGKPEAVSDRHAFGISEQREGLVSMDEDLSKIQMEFRAQRGMLQALHLTQNEHTAVLREHTLALAELRVGQQELRQGLSEARVGIRTIIGLLRSADGGES